ncbi:MAG TPA: AIM24 family protein [Chloroflexi bacterium]|nr:AIM24 family protein [Chloroflexota bacterium]
MEVLSSIEVGDGTVVEVLQYPILRGSSDIRTAEKLFYATQSGLRLKMVHIKLNKSHVRVEPGALYFMKGNLEMKASTGGGVLKGLARKVVAGESFFVNEIHGTGEIYLEPTFGHFLLHRITQKESGVIVDRSLFYAGTAGLDISAAVQKNISSALLGGEGFFQTKITGEGVAVLYSPVPQEEIMRFTLEGDTLFVDGNFALMRSVQVDFSVRKSSKSLLSTAVSGEGLLQTFSGHGYVWIAPTQAIYEKLTTQTGLRSLSQPPGSSNTHTTTSTNKGKK